MTGHHLRLHHRQVIERLTAHFGADERFPALIVAGSIAHGWERDDSDVDIMLVATDEEYARRVAARALTYFTRDFCDYPGGYVDGKIVNLAFLQEVAEKGSEPARAAFDGTWCAYSRLPEVDALVQRIPTYPEAERQARICSFYAQFEAWHWYLGEAVKRGDRYLLTKTLSALLLFGGRLILAHNRILYPYHKWLTTTLAEAPDKPTDLLKLMDAALAQPSAETIEAYCKSILDFTAWNTPPEGWPARFMQDTESAWRRGSAAVEDW